MLLSAFNLNELIQVDEGSFVFKFIFFFPFLWVHYECHMSFIYCYAMQKWDELKNKFFQQNLTFVFRFCLFVWRRFQSKKFVIFSIISCGSVNERAVCLSICTWKYPLKYLIEFRVTNKFSKASNLWVFLLLEIFYSFLVFRN